ncbi:MAG TPA: hypothetical protein VMS65_08655 [Polyangiaceae bacterium]|nr:hypothetical protein [Polyangiaceae bacterium]
MKRNAPSRVGRRAFAGMAVVALLAFASPAFAGTYLNRAVVLLSGATRESSYLRARLGDKELARITFRLAGARLEAARSMTVPKEVEQAHPHLLLVLENYLQAAEAATLGESERFVTFHQRALDEERTFKAVLKQLGWVLPDSP